MEAKLKIERVKAVMQAIRNNSEFDMGEVIGTDDTVTIEKLRSGCICGTPCCVAGTALLLFAPKRWEVIGHCDLTNASTLRDSKGNYKDWSDEARKLLGLTYQQAELFTAIEMSKAEILSVMQLWIDEAKSELASETK